MTVASTTNRKSFSGDGVTTSFGTSPVVFYTASDLVVEVYSSTGAVTTLVNNTNYTVSGGSATGAVGTVNLAGGSSPYGAPAVGTTLLIRRVLPLVQSADFLNNDINDAEVSETALDKLTMITQQINETSGRGLNIPALETATDALTVLPFDRASKYLAFDANKEMIASPGPAGDNVPVSTFMATVLDDTTAADARTTLGAAGSGAVTGSGLTMATSRLLGRTTASTGAIEEISVGTGLSLSGGSLTNTVTDTNNLVLIQSQTASNAASVNFTTGIDGTYDTYLLTLADVVPQTDSTDLYLRVSVDGGANWLAGTTYAYENITGNGGTASVSASTGTAQLLLSNALGTDTGEIWNGALWIQNPSNASRYKSIHGTSVYLNAAAAVTSRAIGCMVKTTSAINAIQVLMSSGNINGKFNLYGVKKT